MKQHSAQTWKFFLSNENMNKLKLTILILITLFLSLGLSACVKKPVIPVETGIQKTATTTEEIDISDWKTYRNEEYGFEFRYPGDWIRKEGLGIQSDIIFLGGIQAPIKDHFDTGVWIFKLSNYNFLACEESFFQYPACITETIDEDYSKTITLKYGNSILRINTYYGKFDSPDLKGVFEKILSTFLFFN